MNLFRTSAAFADLAARVFAVLVSFQEGDIGIKTVSMGCVDGVASPPRSNLIVGRDGMAPTSDTRAVRLVSRAGWAVVLGAIWAIGYFALGARTRRTPAFDPSTALDAWIPFVGWAVWPYLLGIVGIVLPAGLIRSRGLFLRTAVAYAMVIVLSFLGFLLLPTDAASLRQYASTSRLDSLTAWAIETLYAIDPPTNVIPSLHVSLATLAALALSKEYAAYRPLAYVGWAILAASVCTVKQHSALDVLSGTILALAAFSIAGRVSTRGGSL